MSEQADATKVFLDYLDKEMTIMGILSTFCIAAAALVVDRAASADKASFFKDLMTDHPVQVFIGSALLIAAGLCFYLQRSRLAHFYGSTCISLAAPSATEWSTKRWLVESYTWAAWIRYRVGFLFLVLTSLVYSYIIYQEIYPKLPYHWIIEIVVLGIISACILLQIVVLLTHRYSNHPYRDFSFRRFRSDWRNREEWTDNELTRNDPSRYFEDTSE
jgi:hypothetical protein